MTFFWNIKLNTLVIKSLGGFDSRFFMYFEETELQYRMKKNGWSVFSIPSAKIIHLEGSSISNSMNREKRFMSGRDIFNRLTKSKLHKLLTDINFFILNFCALSIAKYDHKKSNAEIYNFRINHIKSSYKSN